MPGNQPWRKQAGREHHAEGLQSFPTGEQERPPSRGWCHSEEKLTLGCGPQFLEDADISPFPTGATAASGKETRVGITQSPRSVASQGVRADAAKESAGMHRRARGQREQSTEEGSGRPETEHTAPGTLTWVNVGCRAQESSLGFSETSGNRNAHHVNSLLPCWSVPESRDEGDRH